MLAVHDGVDAPGATGRMESLCAGLRGAVDLVLGGHTLQCFAGELAGVPFLQPWAFGGQVGVADLPTTTSRCGSWTSRASGRSPRRRRPG